MAKMYPTQVYSNTSSPGEIEVFRRLRDDPITENWIVFHSLDVASHRSQISGEIDFVVVVPGEGILCLEVKATTKVKRENGLWYFGMDSKPEARGPFKQVSEAMHSIRKVVKERAQELSQIVFWSTVIFPYVEFTERSLEWQPWQVIDSKRFTTQSMGQNVLNVLSQARKFLATTPGAKWFNPEIHEPDAKQCKKIVEILRPNFEFFESPASRSTRRESELKTYTQEQFDALDSMESNPRVIFTGPAGTGKTLLGIEAARRSQAKNRKTLFICYNRLLGNWLKENTASLQPGLTMGTLHRQMLNVAGGQLPEDPDQEFWEDELPLKAIEALLETDNEVHQFDSLVIDEAQDIIKEPYLDFLDLSLKGGFNSGNWVMFGDFERQAIYETDQKISGILLKRFEHVPRCSLRVNCRNTPRIAELVHLLGGLNPGYTRIRRPDNKVEPRIISYPSFENQELALNNLLTKLQNEKYPLSEIVILSTRSNQECASSRLLGEWESKLVPMRGGDILNRIRYGTIHSYKGLEAPVVILTDIEEVGTPLSISLFYIGITRALDRLYILVYEKAKKEMLSILTRLGT